MSDAPPEVYNPKVYNPEVYNPEVPGETGGETSKGEYGSHAITDEFGITELYEWPVEDPIFDIIRAKPVKIPKNKEAVVFSIPLKGNSNAELMKNNQPNVIEALSVKIECLYAPSFALRSTAKRFTLSVFEIYDLFFKNRNCYIVFATDNDRSLFLNNSSTSAGFTYNGIETTDSTRVQVINRITSFSNERFDRSDEMVSSVPQGK